MWKTLTDARHTGVVLVCAGVATEGSSSAVQDGRLPSGALHGGQVDGTHASSESGTGVRYSLISNPTKSNTLLVYAMA